VRTGETTTGHRCSRIMTADPDERRARGLHSLVEHALRHRLLDMSEHSPRRSNLSHINGAVITRWRIRCWSVDQCMDVVGAPFPLAGRAGRWVVK
jgi:hypothetical protein